MTVSTHVYEAHLVRTGETDVELPLIGGVLTLDATRAPHVTGSLRISPTSGLSEIIDPRTDARITVDVEATFPSRTDTRTFDLTIRERTVDATGEITVDVASDEALLIDYKPLTDDTTPRDYESSIRDVVDYVLDTVIPGTSLAATPTDDADVTRYWELTNRMPNPSVYAHASPDYITAANTSATEYSTAVGGWIGSSSVRWTASAGNALMSCRQHTANEGETYTAAAYVRANGTQIRFRFRWYDSEDYLIAEVLGDTVTGTLDWTDDTRAVITAEAPTGTAKVGVLLEQVDSTSGSQAWADAFMLYEGDELVEFFYGTSAPTGYTTSWSDVADASTSTRVPIIERDKDSLTWEAGQSALDFLAPLLQAAGLRLICDETRTWTLRNEDYTAPGNLSLRYGINITDASESISRDNDLWFDAAVTRYRWKRNGIEHERYDTYALTTPHTRARMFEKDTPYPGPGFSEYAVRRAQGRGREVSATAVADWRARAEQSAQIFLEDAPTQVGRTETVTFDLDKDEVSVTLRTTEYNDSAWVLLPEDEAWTDSPIGESWTDEVI